MSKVTYNFVIKKKIKYRCGQTAPCRSAADERWCIRSSCYWGILWELCWGGRMLELLSGDGHNPKPHPFPVLLTLSA